MISRDFKECRLIDIDGANRGSIQFPSNYIGGRVRRPSTEQIDLHKPALDVDLATLLPLILQQLMLGKGRGKAFVSEQVLPT